MHAGSRLGAVLLAGAMLLGGGCANQDDGLIVGSLPEDPRQDGHRTVQKDEEGEAKRHFAAGEYGLAEQSYRRVVETNPTNGNAWIGLAATYDQLRRFDLAKRAYDQAMRLQGRTPLLLNNLGYHYYLQGQNGKAEHSWRSAAQMEPGNPKILANLELLASNRVR